MAEIVICARGGGRAKSRCAEVLGPADRARLTELMLEDMIEAVGRTRGATRLWVVTPTPSLAGLAAARGAEVIRQGEDGDLNAAFALGLAEIGERAPYESVALLPGDLPLLQAADLEAALTLSITHAVVLAPAMADGGTGAIVLRSGARLPLSFGRNSFANHAASADRLGLSRAVVIATSLMLDLDRPADLPAVLSLGAGTRTAAFLHERLPSRLTS